MSNLYKNSYVVNSNTVKRIINSNSLIDEKLKESKQGLRFPSFDQSEESGLSEGEDSFIDGIVAEQVEVEPQISTQELLQQAQEEAQLILEEARLQAQAIFEEASGELQSMKEEAVSKGYQEGLSQVQDEYQTKEKMLHNQIEQKKQLLEEEYQTKSDRMENDILDAIIQVMNKVFQVEIKTERSLLLGLIKSTLASVEIGKKFRIRVSEKSFEDLESHKQDILDGVGSDVEMDLVKDFSLEDTDCIIETNFGVFDCGMDCHMENLIRRIKMLRD